MRSILVPMMQDRFEQAAVEAASALASRHEGRVDVLVGLSAVSPLAAGWDYFPANPSDAVNEAAKAATEAIAADALLALEGVRHTVRIASAFWLGPAEQTLAGARTADLVVLGRPKKPRAADDQLFAATLLGAGRPVMVVPESARGRLGFERVVVAWRPTREATRAIHDAIALLQRARSVRIVRIEDAADEANGHAGADQELLEHLKRHALQPELTSLPREGASNGERILQFARDIGAELIVSGGYGHSKEFEHVFGGVTRTLLLESTVPVLFSH